MRVEAMVIEIISVVSSVVEVQIPESRLLPRSRLKLSFQPWEVSGVHYVEVGFGSGYCFFCRGG